jgi:hypothetical protein
MHPNSSRIHRSLLECLSAGAVLRSLWQPLTQGPAPAALDRCPEHEKGRGIEESRRKPLTPGPGCHPTTSRGLGAYAIWRIPCTPSGVFLLLLGRCLRVANFREFKEPEVRLCPFAGL